MTYPPLIGVHPCRIVKIRPVKESAVIAVISTSENRDYPVYKLDVLKIADRAIFEDSLVKLDLVTPRSGKTYCNGIQIEEAF